MLRLWRDGVISFCIGSWPIVRNHPQVAAWANAHRSRIEGVDLVSHISYKSKAGRRHGQMVSATTRHRAEPDIDSAELARPQIAVVTMSPQKVTATHRLLPDGQDTPLSTLPPI